MKIENPVKAVLAVLSLVCVTLLMALGKVNTDAGLGILGTISGYAIGNGVNARTGKDASNIIGKKTK